MSIISRFTVPPEIPCNFSCSKIHGKSEVIVLQIFTQQWKFIDRRMDYSQTSIDSATWAMGRAKLNEEQSTKVNMF